MIPDIDREELAHLWVVLKFWCCIDESAQFQNLRAWQRITLFGLCHVDVTELRHTCSTLSRSPSHAAFSWERILIPQIRAACAPCSMEYS
jgi:hypothetical protein